MDKVTLRKAMKAAEEIEAGNQVEVAPAPGGVVWADCSECGAKVTALTANALGTVHFAQPCGHKYAEATKPVGTKEERLAACDIQKIPLSLVVEFANQDCSICKGEGLVQGTVKARLPPGVRKVGQPHKVDRKAMVACRCAVARVQREIQRQHKKR